MLTPPAPARGARRLSDRKQRKQRRHSAATLPRLSFRLTCYAFG